VEISEIIWLDSFVEKLWRKHHVRIDEVEEVLYGQPQVRRVKRGDVAGEDILGYGSDQRRTAPHRFLCSESWPTGTGYQCS